MKTKIIFILLCFLSLNVMGQGVVMRNKKPKTTQTQPTKTQSTKTKTKTKTVSKAKPAPEPEAAGYDVTFSCNASSSTLYIDGNAYGNTSGTRFLKTGNHSIKVTAEGYKDYEGSISVNRQNNSCEITLEKNPIVANFQNGILNVNGISYKMINVKGGTFQMGRDSEEQHSVTLSSYYIGETEIIQDLWMVVMGSNPSYYKGSYNPVEQVSWNDCQEFISRLNAATGKKFRLPTEAEWEYAARGGNKSRGYHYSGSDYVRDVAWSDNMNGKTHAVKTRKPNELGIYDMSGNVQEWCQDKFADYSSSPQINPTGPAIGSNRVTRGGNYFYSDYCCGVAYRMSSKPNERSNGLGLRLALSE